MFKESFKYYKRKQPAPDLSNVLDVSKENELVEVINPNPKYAVHKVFGLNSVNSWKIYTLRHKDGLVIIRNPFTPSGQRYWIIRCLKDFSTKPQKLNLDAHDYLAPNEDWWTKCQQEGNKDLLLKLRWATLGYHHNWDTKHYSEANKDPFPKDLAELCRYVADVAGFQHFTSQAAIVNYYHLNSTLSGHTDHSEENLDAPLLSFSFGQTAIFLIGGKTEDCQAIPLFLQSGDIVIMSRESRLCYHAIPKILISSDEPWNRYDGKETGDTNYNEEYFKPFCDYIKHSRINMNVRQVLNCEQTVLSLNNSLR